ncbi:cardiolipin synthase [Roseinatronobacter alkalisoli]|uniref:Cardiolipin synthase n=1 Tax=Roseinatronobacter alkalisoli TaxID=3028235 RepID=A0ABT5T407_9RHOB|nr:cardiolipin synthase [Roseinatronobacter sp. HJB301]MDD7969851.1 cardiolipin synthase [Roseinatronobacter sp. HJB301]
MAPATVVLVVILQVGFIIRALLRAGLSPSARLAWVTIISALPGVGIAAYFLFGEIRLARAGRERMREVRHKLLAAQRASPQSMILHTGAARPAFAAGQATSQFPPVRGNRLTLLVEGDEMMQDVFDAIAAARDHVHVLFYIWLPDDTGTRMAQGLMDAARRGVTCRVLVDDHGARRLIRSNLWQLMGAAGVALERAAPVGNPFISMLFQRIDLRNHRKIIVVDNRLSWIGSRNCADAAFAIKPRFAPWVDILVRLEGPVVQQQQAVFLHDWMTHHAEDLSHMLRTPIPPAPQDPQGKVTAQVIASGPDDIYTTPSDALRAIIYAATEGLMLTTPYYVPDPALHTAICSAAERGVQVDLIVPARNDSAIVGAASESLYPDLLRAGVRIHLFEPGLIHSKIATVDGQFGMIGTANLDHRSFDLNYENSLLFQCPDFTACLDARQRSYIARATTIDRADVAGWSIIRRLRNNILALASPLL